MSNFYLAKNQYFPAVKRLSEKRIASEIIGSSRISYKQFYACVEEIVYDSMMPKIDDLLKKEGVSMAYLPTLGNYLNVGTYLVSPNAGWYDKNQNLTIEILGKNTQIDARLWGTKSNYSEWNDSYPFEGKYNLIRQKIPPQKYDAYDWIGRNKKVTGISFEILNVYENEVNDNNLPKRRKILLDKEAYFSSEFENYDFEVLPTIGVPQVEGTTYSEFELQNPEYIIPKDWDWNFNSDPMNSKSFYKDRYPFYKRNDLLPPTTKETYKFFFGFGDGKNFLTLQSGDNVLTSSYVGQPTFNYVDSQTILSGNFTYHSGTAADSGGLDVVTGVNIRGWKYGIFDAMPRSFGCFYRRNRYGQFRDMLEQRQFTTLFNINSGEINPGPIEIKFMRMVTTSSIELFPPGSYLPITAAQIDSYTKDEYARETRPFVDKVIYISEIF